uniref:Kinesin motor domain-containing protein n=1 Tax=Sinocyclocheilus grahami TaxID=75366 RepID=A0A672K8S8_SINGR
MFVDESNGLMSEMAQRVAVNDGAPGSKRTSRVRVAVRLRPYMDKQDEKGEGPCVRGLGPQKLEIINWRNATETLQYQSVVLFLEVCTLSVYFVFMPFILSPSFLST